LRLARLAAAALAAALLAGPAGAAPDPAAQLLVEVNAVRAQQGLGALKRDARLDRAAAGHSMAMAEKRFFDHRAPDGTTAEDRVTSAGYRYRLVGENIAAGMENAATVVKQWMLSDGHRRNLLEPRARDAGIGYVAGPKGEYRQYWTLIVAEPARP
jgi:uncharacterized protein YkwD